MPIPTAFQVSRGRTYSRKVGLHPLQLYKRDGIYFVVWGPHSRGFWTYEEARQHASTILLHKGVL